MCWKSQERMTLVACLGRMPLLALDELSSWLKKFRSWFNCSWSCGKYRRGCQECVCACANAIRIVIDYEDQHIKETLNAAWDERVCWRRLTCEFWMRIVPGDRVCVTSCPRGVTTVTGWYTVPPGLNKHTHTVNIRRDERTRKKTESESRSKTINQPVTTCVGFIAVTVTLPCCKADAGTTIPWGLIMAPENELSGCEENMCRAVISWAEIETGF